MKNQLDQALSESKSVLILLPKDPYFDQVAAGLGLYLTLKKKYDVSISTPNDITVEFNRLIGVNEITSELGSNNLVIRLDPAYHAEESIERVFYDNDEKGFRLSVVPKPGVKPPQRDQVIVGYGGGGADAVIMIGGLHEHHFPALSLEELKNTKLISINTQELSFAKERGVFGLVYPASSISEVTASLLLEGGYEVEADHASNLLTGMYVGSKNFADGSITADTFQTAADLMKFGARNLQNEEPKKKNYPPGAIPGSMPRLSNKPPQFDKKNENDDGDPPHPAEELQAEPPKSWMAPKIYKGTSTA